MTLLLVAIVVFFLPVLTGVLALCENLRAGEVRRQRELCNGRLAWGLALFFLDSVWSLWLTVLVMPFGWLPQTGARVKAPLPGPGFPGADSEHGVPARPPVILVHGLYHNPAAWFLMRLRLRRAGYTDVRCYGYLSFGREFAEIAGGLVRLMLVVGKDAPGGRVLLMGHSLGGLLVRAACADARIAAGEQCRVAAVVTLGAPHRGSTLAGRLGVGRLAQSLAVGGATVRLVRALSVCSAPALSLFTPTDCMVQPLSGAFLDQREKAAGWQERALPPMSHVGLLYRSEPAREALAFFEKVLGG